MSQDLPLVTVALETYNADSEGVVEFADVLGQLRNQTYPRDRIEIDLIVDEDNEELQHLIRKKFPWARIVPVKDATYYGMKAAAMQNAQGDIVALTDADCVIPTDYVERLVQNFRDGADVVVGRVRFTPGARWAKTFNLFCFAYIRGDDEGRTDTFSVNNVAFRREVAHEHPFDPRIRRSGGAYLLGRKLAAAGYRIVYDPAITVHHDAYDLRFQMLMRVRSGYEVVSLSKIDDEGILPESKFGRLGILGPPLASGFRFLYDMKLIAEDRRDLGISLLEIPYFVAASAVIRTVETAAGVLTVLRPRYLRDRFGW